MDSIPVPDIRRFESELLEFIKTSHPQIFDVIAATRELTDDTVVALKKVVDEFKLEFRVGN
jgi:F-type H+-transporting ATPase subunit alpha